MVSNKYLRESNIFLEESLRLRKEYTNLGDLDWVGIVSKDEIRMDGYFTKEQLQLAIDALDNVNKELDGR